MCTPKCACPPLFFLQTLWPGEDEGMDRDQLRRRKIFVSTTSVVILFTVFVQGSLTSSALDWFGIECGVQDDDLQVKASSWGLPPQKLLYHSTSWL